MSGFASFPGHEVRARVGHPVIDSDAHLIEAQFALQDFIRQVGGERMVERSLERLKGSPYFRTRTIWWGAPSGRNTADRAMAMLPKYFAACMEECGFDFAHMLTTTGINGLYIPDAELRQATCRALNTMYAEIFHEVRDRVRPVAVIPAYTPDRKSTRLNSSHT